MREPFPVDIWSVKRYGVRRWLDGFFWPVPDAESLAMATALDRSFVESFDGIDPRQSDLLLACYGVTRQCWDVLDARLVTVRLLRSGRQPVSDSRSPYLEQMAASTRAHLSVESPLRMADVAGWRRLGARAQTLYYGLGNRRFDLSAIPGFASLPELGSWGYPSAAQLAYGAHTGRTVGLIHPALWVPKRTESPSERDRAHQAFGDTFVQGVCRLAKQHDADLTAAHLDLLIQVVFQWIDCVADSVRELVDRIPPGPSTILANSLGSPLMKCFSVAARRKGHQVLGFPHGHYGEHDDAVKSYNEFSVVDRYVVPTERSRALYERTQAKHPLPSRRRVGIKTLEEDGQRARRLRLRKDPVPNKIRSIMFVEFPLTPRRFLVSYSYWAFQLEIVTRVSCVVRRLGYRTILKRHPDRLAESENVYDEFFDDLISEPVRANLLESRCLLLLGHRFDDFSFRDDDYSARHSARSGRLTGYGMMSANPYRPGARLWNHGPTPTDVSISMSTDWRPCWRRGQRNLTPPSWRRC